MGHGRPEEVHQGSGGNSAKLCLVAVFGICLIPLPQVWFSSHLSCLDYRMGLPQPYSAISSLLVQTVLHNLRADAITPLLKPVRDPHYTLLKALCVAFPAPKMTAAVSVCPASASVLLGAESWQLSSGETPLAPLPVHAAGQAPREVAMGLGTGHHAYFRLWATAPGSVMG